MTKSLPLALVAVATAFLTAPGAAAQNEIRAGYSHFRPLDENVTEIGYTRYLDKLDNGQGALLINPYLQRVSGVSVNYATYRSIDNYGISGTGYMDEHWSLSGSISGSDYSRTYYTFDGDVDISERSIKLSAGYNINPKLQVGAGVDYDWFESSLNDDGIKRTFDDDDYSPSIYTRYTDLHNGQGWDLHLAGRFHGAASVTASARYFFNKGLSAEVALKDSSGFRRLIVGVDYWFTPALSLRVGASTEVGNENEGYSPFGDTDVNSLTAKARYRF